MHTSASPGTSVPCRRSIGPWNATGKRCLAVVVGKAECGGECFIEFVSAFRCCDQSCISLIGSCSLSQCCKSTSEERSAGKLHATFCGSRRQATASGHPVVSSIGILPRPGLLVRRAAQNLRLSGHE